MAVLWDALQGTALFGVGLRGRGAAHQDQGWAMDCSKCATVAQRWDFRVGGCGGSTARGTGNIYVAVAGSVLLEGLKTINAGLAHLGWRGGGRKHVLYPVDIAVLILRQSISLRAKVSAVTLMWCLLITQAGSLAGALWMRRGRSMLPCSIGKCSIQCV